MENLEQQETTHDFGASVNNGNTQGNEGKNNYTFNNCSVTINEEGKAIDVLQKKQELAEKKTEMTMAMINGLSEVLKAYLSRPTPTPTPKKPTKKQPVKKAPTRKKNRK